MDLSRDLFVETLRQGHGWVRLTPTTPAMAQTDSSHDSRPIYSRAYVLMANPDALVAFHHGFDGHIFKAKTGVWAVRSVSRNDALH